MESVPEPSIVEEAKRSQEYNSDVQLTSNQADIETKPVLSNYKAKALGCVACLTNRGKNPATETARTFMECSGASNDTTVVVLKYLSDQQLITSRDRTSKPASGGRKASRKEYLLTDKGSDSLPDDWSRCRKVEEINPIERLTERQRNLARCVACLISQGVEIRNESIAQCANKQPRNVRLEMQKLVADGLLTNHVLARRLTYQLAPDTAALLPKPPPKDACNFVQSELQRGLSKLTPEQQRILGCISCISARTTNEFGAEKTVVEQCTGAKTAVSARAGHKLADMGLIEQNRHFTENGTNNASRIFYKLNATGQELADAIELEIECREPEIIDAVHIPTAVKKCLECLWAQQVSTNVEPAAALNMISRCTGIYDEPVLRALDPLLQAGQIQKIAAPVDVLNGMRQETIAFAPPPEGLAQLRTQEACNLVLYPEVPSEYLQPVGFARLIGHEKSSSLSKADFNAFIRSKMHHPNLTKEQEFALGDIIQNSPDKDARERAVAAFVENNVRLAWWVTVHKAALGRLFLSFEDCTQEALRGVDAAARRYDPSFGVRFNTYARYWIKQRIQRTAAAYAGIPVNKFVMMSTAYFKAEEFKVLYDRKPTVLELAFACNLTPKQILGIMEARKSLAKPSVSLDDDAYSDKSRGSRFGGDKTAHEMIGFEQADFDSVEVFEAVQKIVPYLAEHEKAVLGNMLGYHVLTRDQIGEMFGVSAMTIHKAKQRVNSLLRHPYFGIAANSGSQAWQLDAACATSNNSAVVERVQATRGVPPKVAELCGFCPVRKECFTATLKSDKPVTAGIWAGFNPAQLREYHERSRSARVTKNS